MPSEVDVAEAAGVADAVLRVAPQPVQNLAPGRLSLPHLLHFIDRFSRCRWASVTRPAAVGALRPIPSDGRTGRSSARASSDDEPRTIVPDDARSAARAPRCR